MDPAAILDQKPRRALIVVAATAIAVHVGALRGPFTAWDDDLYVTANPRVQDATLQGLLTLWSPAAALDGRFIEYFPLRDTLYWALHALFGLAPTPYHLLIVLLHALVCVQLVVVARRLQISPAGALAAGLVFAVHAVHVESVAWIAALKDPLFTVFFLAALDRWLVHRAHGRARDLALAVVAFTAGFLVKALIVTLPLALFLVDQALPPRRALKATIASLAPFVVVTLPFMALIMKVARVNDVIVPYPGGTFATGMLTTAWSYVVYLSKALLPIGLNTRYVMPPVMSPTEPRALIAFAVIAALTLAAVVARKQRPEHLFGLAWWAGALLPVVNLIPHRIEVADRYQYVPTLGLALWVGFLVDRGARRSARATYTAVACVVALFSALTIAQVRVWTDEVLLWRQVAAQDDAPHHSFVWNMLGTALRAQGKDDEALAMFDQGGRVVDDFVHLPRANAARLRLLRGELDHALADARSAIDAKPDSGETWATLASVLRARGELDLAHDAYGEAMRTAPRDATHAWNRAGLSIARGRFVDAGADVRRAVELDPSLCARYARLRGSLGADAAAIDASLGAACTR